MDLFRTVIDGPYALLLVLQILVVAGLLLTLLWLFIYRAKESEGADFAAFVKEGGAPADAHAHAATAPTTLASATVAVDSADKPVILPASPDGLMDLTSATLGNFSESAPALGLAPDVKVKTGASEQGRSPGDDIFAVQASPAGNAKPEVVPQPTSTPIPKPVEATTQVAADTELLNGARAESEMLKSKLEFLESKLLEYEIVQEEIANLSSLKMENEKLREELVQMQRTRPAMSAPAAEVAPVVESGREVTIPTAPIATASTVPIEQPSPVTPSMPNISLSNEPGMSMDGVGQVATEYPPEPLPDNVIQLSMTGKEPTLGKVKEVVEAFQDPKINTQLESILSKLDQLTNK